MIARGAPADNRQVPASGNRRTNGAVATNRSSIDTNRNSASSTGDTDTDTTSQALGWGVASPELYGLVAHLRENPRDDSARLILADLLDEIGPSPVERQLPGWFEQAWDQADVKLPGWYDSVEDHVAEFLERANPGYSGWDHAGTAVIAGLDCLVSEPYAPFRPNRAKHLFRPIMDVLPCAYAFAREGWHPRPAKGIFPTVRAILFPPPEGSEKRRRRT
jgi:uncharacterized protein (TIGR02996 family)